MNFNFSDRHISLILSLVLAALLFGFLWYEIRPSEIIQECARDSGKYADEGDWQDFSTWRLYYDRCLIKRGIDTEITETTTLLGAFN